jgi:hypothetical protein
MTIGSRSLLTVRVYVVFGSGAPRIDGRTLDPRTIQNSSSGPDADSCSASSRSHEAQAWQLWRRAHHSSAKLLIEHPYRDRPTSLTEACSSAHGSFLKPNGLHPFNDQRREAGRHHRWRHDHLTTPLASIGSEGVTIRFSSSMRGGRAWQGGCVSHGHPLRPCPTQA